MPKCQYCGEIFLSSAAKTRHINQRKCPDYPAGDSEGDE